MISHRICVVFSLLFALSESGSQLAWSQPSNLDESCSKTSSLCWPRLKPNSKGAAVQTFQRLLNTKGFKLNTLGMFDTKTSKAVKTFQAQHKLKIDGIVGFQTWESITPSLRKNDKGATVKILQGLLWDKNHATARDGVYGSDTERQVKAFQKRVASTPTGVADLEVWCQLVGGSGSGAYSD